MKIGITGASGMLGTALIKELSKYHQIFATSRAKKPKNAISDWNNFDLTDDQALVSWLDQTKPEAVIHCAAMIGVDQCEDHEPYSRKLHAETTKVIANHLALHNKKLIYISSDSVFNGQKKTPYVELDPVGPLNVYAETKLLGEKPVLLMRHGIVLRTNIIGWGATEKTSFFEWVLKGLLCNKTLNLFNDVLFSPLNVSHLASIIKKIIDRDIYGLYHCGSSDHVSKYDFGKKIADVFNLSTNNISKASIDDFNLKARRAKNMALDSSKLRALLEHELPSVEDGIKLMKKQYDSNLYPAFKANM